MKPRRYLVTVEMLSHHTLQELREIVPMKMAVLGEVQTSTVLHVRRPEPTRIEISEGD